MILPNLVPAILGGAALAFARAVGEFGSIVLISGNIPFDTQVASVFIFKQIESDNPIGAAAVSVVLLLLSLCSCWSGSARSAAGGRGMTVDRRGGSGCASSRSATCAVLLLVPVGLVFYRTFEDGLGAVWDSITTPAAIPAFWLTLDGHRDRRAAQHGLRRALRAGARARALPRQGGCSTRSSTCRSRSRRSWSAWR